jgi:hypothetical protein
MKTYRVTFNYENGDAGTVGEFDNLQDAIRCFDATNFEQNPLAYEIEIKKFVGDELEEFKLSELPQGYEEYEGWFIKRRYS